MSEERTIRPSSLVTHQDCARRWAARHLRGEIQAAGYELRVDPPSHVGALVGSGVHAGTGLTLAQMRASGALGPEQDAIDAGIQAFRDRMEAEGVQWDDVTERAATAERQIQRMVKVYRRQVAPLLEPLMVEERLEATIGEGWVISGQPDGVGNALAMDRHDPERRTLRDTKTGTRRRANGPQYGCYALLLGAHGAAPARAYEDYIARVPVRDEQPPVAVYATDLRRARLEAAEQIRRIQRDTAEWEARLRDPHGPPAEGAFAPNPASSLCSARFCPAWGTPFCTAHL